MVLTETGSSTNKNLLLFETFKQNNIDRIINIIKVIGRTKRVRNFKKIVQLSEKLLQPASTQHP